LAEPTEAPWPRIVRRLQSDKVSENMLRMKDFMLKKEEELSPIQRLVLYGITSSIASVYRNAYTFEHFDYILYQYKSLRLMEASDSANDSEILTDPKSKERRLMLELPSALRNIIIIGGFREDLTPNTANELVDYLESDMFSDFIRKIV
jgi:hypothetical protein